MNNLPRVSVVIPMRNEEAYIGRCLESVVTQDYPRELVEVLVVDGGSDDESLEIVKQFAEEYSNIRLLGGPGVNCPAAMNMGLEIATGSIIAKVDAHGYIAPDFLKISVNYLSKEANVKCVGGPIRPVARTSVEKTNVFVRSSVFGVGKGVYSLGEEPQFVDTVQCGVYDKDIFEEVGVFDESLQFGEDEEINWRIRKRGYKIFSTPEIRFFYFPRNSFGGLYRQYFNYGMLRVKVVRKHPDFCRLKHIIPAAFVLSLFLAGVLGILGGLFLKVFFGIVFFYIIVSFTVSAAISANEGWKYLCLLPIGFGALHFGYGMGFVKGFIRLLRSA